MIKQQSAVVHKNVKVALDTYYMELATPAVNQPVRPGQFVHIEVPGREDLLLRRPISVNTVDKDNGLLSLIIQAKGDGTKAICALNEGDNVDMIGAVGKGYTMPKETKRAAVIGGGIGVAPLRYIMEHWSDVSYDAYIGFRECGCAYQVDEFDKLSDQLYVSCDDGSIGTKGFVTDILREQLSQKQYDIIFACGPTPMLKALKNLMDKHEIPCQVSLEERMGCGIGACKVCVCKTNSHGDTYKKVCSEGPVFDIAEVEL